MDKTVRRVVMASVVAVLPAVVAVGPAQADTESCASHSEYDNLVTGLSVNQVYNRFDIYGYYLGDTQTYFKRGYKTCWAPGVRRIVVAYSYDTGNTINWWVEDV